VDDVFVCSTTKVVYEIFNRSCTEKLQDHRRREENEYLGTSRGLPASGECKCDADEVTRGSPGRVQRTAISESEW
jgi:hypothetical protein